MGLVGYTPAGRAYCLTDGTFGATANAAFLSLAFGQLVRPWRPDLADIYLCWARQQARPCACMLCVCACMCACATARLAGQILHSSFQGSCLHPALAVRSFL